MKIRRHFSPDVMLARPLVRLLTAVILCFAALASQVALAGCLDNRHMTGVSLAGAEFNNKKLPGRVNHDYVYPNAADFDFVKRLGGGIVRLPFLWERLQPELFGELDADETARLAATVKLASARGICLILDLHNYGMYRGVAVGSEEVPAKALYDVWSKLARRFGNPQQVILGLMNEPAKMSMPEWADTAKDTLAMLREDGAKQIVLVSGGRWSGVHDWKRKFGGVSNASLFEDLDDPLDRTWIEVHQYADRDSSGRGKECGPTARLEKMFADITGWAKASKQRLFLGEFGVPPSPGCLEALETMLDGMRDKKVWGGWTYWAAGRWWGDYPFSIQPRDGADAPQVDVLTRYLAGPAREH